MNIQVADDLKKELIETKRKMDKLKTKSKKRKEPGDAISLLNMQRYIIDPLKNETKENRSHLLKMMHLLQGTKKKNRKKKRRVEAEEPLLPTIEDEARDEDDESDTTDTDTSNDEDDSD